MNLKDVLSGGLDYSSEWAVYAELNALGIFTPESEARIGQKMHENGGLLDDCVYFGSNDHIVDFLYEWNPEDPEDGIDELIDSYNSAL